MLIYATTNEAKLSSMRKMLAELPVAISGLNKLPMDLPDIKENGADPLANAVIKAHAYFNVIKQPLFSADSGLYIDGLPDSEQPGVHVRQINGCRLTDDEMIDHYADIAKRMGGFAKARYVNGLCLILSENQVFTHTGDDISYEPFYLADKPHPHREKGFPLDSLSVQIASGRYYYDLNNANTLALKTTDGFIRFFRDALSAANIQP